MDINDNDLSLFMAAQQGVVDVQMIEETEESFMMSECNTLLDSNWDIQSVESENDVTQNDFAAVEGYRALLKLYRDLPKDMFVAEVLKEYSTSEPDLDRIRTYYFEHLKNVHQNFPYDRDAELKRRVYTRSGEPVTVKLAHDIHSLIEVTEGGDCSILKPMISTGKNRKQSVVTSELTKSTSETIDRKKDNCACHSDIKLLKVAVSSLKSNMLLTQQIQHTNEKIRNEQLKCIKSTLESVKNELNMCRLELIGCAEKSGAKIQSLSTSIMEQILGFEDRLRLLECFLDAENIVTVSKLNCECVYSDARDLYNNTHGSCNKIIKESGINLPNQCQQRQPPEVVESPAEVLYMQTDQRNINLHEEKIKGDILTAPVDHFYDRQPADESSNFRIHSQEGRSIPVRVTARTEFRPND